MLHSIEHFHMTSRRPYWCSKTIKRRPCWSTKQILWELNSFLMSTLHFVSINLHRCWSRDWKRSIHVFVAECCIGLQFWDFSGGRHKFFHSLLHSNAGQWVKIRFPKQSHAAVRDNTDPVSSTTFAFHFTSNDCRSLIKLKDRMFPVVQLYAKEKLLPLNYFEIVPVCLVCRTLRVKTLFQVHKTKFRVFVLHKKLIIWRFRLLKRQRMTKI